MGIREKEVLTFEGRTIATAHILVGLSDYQLEIYNALDVTIACHFKILKADGSWDLHGVHIESGKEYAFPGTNAAPSGHSYIKIDGFDRFKIAHINHPAEDEYKDPGKNGSPYSDVIEVISRGDGYYPSHRDLNSSSTGVW